MAGASPCQGGGVWPWGVSLPGGLLAMGSPSQGGLLPMGVSLAGGAVGWAVVDSLSEQNS